MSSFRSKSGPIDILLVEDNEDEAYLIGECFNEAKVNHVLHSVGDGAGALDFLGQCNDHENAPRPDLIVLDISLPKVGGLEVLGRIKSDPELRRVPVVVLTGSRNERLKRECLDLHANCFITKPRHAGDYLKTVRQIREFWLSHHGPRLDT